MDTPKPKKSLACRFGHCHWITGYKAKKCHSLVLGSTTIYTMERVDDDTDMDVEEMQAAPSCWTVSSSSFTNNEQHVAEIEQQHNHGHELSALPLSFSTLHISSALPPPQQHHHHQHQQHPQPPEQQAPWVFAPPAADAAPHHIPLVLAPPPPPPQALPMMTRNDLLASLLAFKDSIGPPSTESLPAP
jgi:hypothetical protein